MATKTRRFLSRKVAEFNEGKVQGAAGARELDEDLAQSMGAGILRRSELSDTIKQRTREAELVRENAKVMYKSYAGASLSLGTFVDNLRSTRAAAAGYIDTFQQEATQQEGSSSSSSSAASSSTAIAFPAAPGQPQAQLPQPADILKTSLSEVSLIHDIMCNGLEALNKSMDANLVQQFQGYVKGEVRDARYFSHDFLKVQVEYEAALNKLNQMKLKGSKTEPKRVSAAQQELDQVTEKFDLIAEEALHRFNRLNEADTYKNALHVIDYLATVQSFFETGQRIFQELAPKLEKFKQEAMKNLEENDRIDREEMRLRAGSIQEKRNTSILDEFADLVTKQPLNLLNAIVETSSFDDVNAIVIPTALRVFHHRAGLPEVFNGLATAEITACDNGSKWIVKPIFVPNSIGARLITEFSRTVAKPYISFVIKPIIQAVALEKQVIELDPSKASFEQVEHATKRLAHHFGALLTNIVRSRAVCPKPIRDICCDIKLIAKGHKKAGNWRAHVCSFLFSRLFLPALAVPEQCGLFNEYDQPLSLVAKRTLALLTGMLRNCVHRSKADQFPQEAYLRVFDKDVEEKWALINDFLEQMSMPLSVQAILNASDSSGTCVPSDTSDTFSTPDRLAEMETMLMNWCNDNEVIVLAAKLDPVYSKVSALLMQKNDTESFGVLNKQIKTLHVLATRYLNEKAAEQAQMASAAAAASHSSNGGAKSLGDSSQASSATWMGRALGRMGGSRKAIDPTARQSIAVSFSGSDGSPSAGPSVVREFRSMSDNKVL